MDLTTIGIAETNRAPRGTEDWDIYLGVTGLTPPVTESSLAALEEAAYVMSFNPPSGLGHVEFLITLPEGLALAWETAQTIDGRLHRGLIYRPKRGDRYRSKLTHYPPKPDK